MGTLTLEQVQALREVLTHGVIMEAHQDIDSLCDMAEEAARRKDRMGEIKMYLTGAHNIDSPTSPQERIDLALKVINEQT